MSHPGNDTWGASRRSLLALTGISAATLLTGSSPASARSSRSVSLVADQFNNGTQDASDYLNDLIRMANQGSGVGVVRLDGTYRLDSPLLARSSVRVVCASGTRVRRNWDDPAGGAPGRAMVRNLKLGAKVNNFSVRGGSWGADNPERRRGNVFNIYGDDFECEDVRVDGWSKGRAWLVVGDGTRLTDCTAINSTGLVGDGGIRVAGGSGGIAIRCHVESGDDALQFVPVGDGSTTNPTLYSRSIRDWRFVDCSGSSTEARFMNATLQNRDDDAVMNASIIDVSFEGCHGKGGSSYAARVMNENSTGSIDGVTFRNCSVVGRSDIQAGIAVQRYPENFSGKLGAVRDVSLVNVTVSGVSPAALSCRGGIDYLNVSGCDLGGAVDVSGTRNSRVVDTTIRATGTGNVVALGTVDRPGSTSKVAPMRTEGFLLSACRIVGLTSTNLAINSIRSAGTTIQRTSFSAASSAPDARGLRVGGETDGIVVQDNDFTGIQTPKNRLVVDQNARGVVVRQNVGA